MSIALSQYRNSSGSMPALWAPGAYWSDSRAFVFAAAGTAIGLGNVWRFPYLVDRYGGGAFVLAYLGGLLVLGLPILMAEILVGRRGRSSPAGCLGTVARAEGRNCRWRFVGWIGCAGAVLVLSVYSLVAGWSIAFLGRTGTVLAHASPTAPGRQLLASLLNDPRTMIGCHTLFLGCITLIAARRIRSELERIQSWLLPALLLVLLGLLVYAAGTTGRLGDGLSLVLWPDFSRLGWRGVLEALRHAFLTLGLGLGAMISYGAALPEGASIPRVALTVVALDTLVALLAAVVVSALLLAGGVSQAEGLALAFTAIPAATAVLPGGQMAAIAFYGFLTLAALSSGIGILYPIVDQIEGWFGIGRRRAALLAGGSVWLLGVFAIVVVRSPGIMGLGPWAIFDALSFLGSTLVLPVSALGVVLFTGWAMSRGATRRELRLSHRSLFITWRWLIRYLVPLALLAILVMGIVKRV